MGVNSSIRGGPLRRSDLLGVWNEQHEVVQDEKQSSLTIDKNNVHQTSLCARHGVCVCKGTQRLLPLFQKKLVDGMKKLFPGTKKKPTPQRLRFLDGFYVFGLKGEPMRMLNSQGGLIDVDGTATIFFHIGAINLSTWDFCCLQLYPDTDGIPASEMSTTVFLNVFPHHTAALEPKCALKFLCENVDLAKPWSLQCYTILGDQEPVPSSFMAAQYVEVQQQHDMEKKHFWEGTAAELEKLLKKRRAQNKRSGTGTGRGSGDSGGQQQHKHSSAETQRQSAENIENMDAIDEALKILKGTTLENTEKQPAVDINDLDDLWQTIDDEIVQDESAQDDDANDVDDDGQNEHSFGGNEQDLIDLFNMFSDNNANEQAEVEEESEPLLPADLPDPPPPPPAALEEEERPPPPPEPMPKRPRATRAEESRPRSSKNPEEVFTLPGIGEIRYNTKGFMRAHCSNPAHGTCTRQRPTTKGRHGAGRPLGSLVAWLQESESCSAKEEHVKMVTSPWRNRIDGRAWFMTLRGAASFASYEREKYDYELEEPMIMP